MKLLPSMVIAAATLLAADEWAKVVELKSGTELRIVKDGGKQPVMAQMDHATEDNLFIATKKEQLVIPKSEIQRIDYRPKGGSRITKESTVKKSGPGNPSPSEQRIGGGAPGPSHSASTNLSIGSKPDFETIYRRRP
jgi:hypothetical protein